MIDLTLLRMEPDRIIAAITRKDPHFPIEQLIALDREVRIKRSLVENLRADKNELAHQAKSGVTDEIRERSREVSKLLKEAEESLRAVEQHYNDLYLRCPNIPNDDIPDGGKEANRVVKIFGEKPEFSFPIKNHLELGTDLGWFDFDAAARMAGSQFALYKGEGVKLIYSLAMYMLMHNMRKGYSPVLPPYLVNEKTLEGASNFPRFKDEVYTLEADKMYLTPTSEVNLANMYRDHIFMADDLPVTMTAWTSCFRREAGGYGATERGLIRIHQFEKVELFTICTPEDSEKEQQRMVATAEEILQKLGLHYRVTLLAAQDCSFASAKTYDIEVWMPGQKEYKEVSSVSMCTDFQSRRCAMRYRKHAHEKTQLVHTLNASSLALPRLMVALMETYQTSDGEIVLPDALRKLTFDW